MSYKSKILELYEQGLGVNEISRIIGCAKSVSSYHIQRRMINTELGTKGKALSQEQISQINNSYKKNGNISQVVRETGFAKQTIRRYLNVNGPEIRRLTATEIARRHRRKVKRMLVEYKGGKCEKCGYSKCIGALDFHHRNAEEKDFNITSSTVSFQRAKLEVDKCDLLCSNCHREIHYQIESHEQIFQ